MFRFHPEKYQKVPKMCDEFGHKNMHNLEVLGVEI